MKLAKKWLSSKIILFLLPAILIIGGIYLTVNMLMIIFLSSSSTADCEPSTSISTNENTQVPNSIEDFVKEHKDSYILSWKAGGFLPSASIAQTMVENGFNFTNPSGTSFWKAHNMGGVKTSKISDFPITLKTFGQDSVDITGTKEGTNVGDNTGGAYTWFKDYHAGIVGKAEFMAHQSLYTGAINNTNGIEALTAIYKGGWATDPTYLVKLTSTYNDLGKQFEWLDKEAIAKYGTTPYENKFIVDPITGVTTDGAIEGSQSSFADKCDITSTGASDSNILESAKKYVGWFTYPNPIAHNLAMIGGDPRNPDRNGQTDCSGFVWLALENAGYNVPPNMGWFTGSMTADARGQNQWLKAIPESEAEAGDIVIVNLGGGAGANGHTAIIAEKWHGSGTKIIQMGGDNSITNESTFNNSFSSLLNGGDICFARAVKK